MPTESGLWEVEQKFPLALSAGGISAGAGSAAPLWSVNLVTANEIRAKLTQLGARWEKAIQQADHYFAHPCRDFRKSDEALRLRRVGDDNVITYKGPKLDTTTKTREEIELSILPGAEGLQQFQTLLERLGFVHVYVVRKTRLPGCLSYEGGEVHLALDTVEGLGDFLEIEVLAQKESLDTAKRSLESLGKTLELSITERRGYLDLLMQLSARHKATD